jgi:signal transduction histidine kinase
MLDERRNLDGAMSLEKWMMPRKPAHRLLVASVCFAALGLIGLIDYWADYRLMFTVLYVLPIGFATVYVGRTYAIVLSVLAVVIWTGGDILGGAPSPGLAIRAWNDGIVLSLFLIIIYLLDALRRALVGLEATVEERTQALRLEMEERQYLEQETLEISERERQTFGHELHDVVCQELTGIGIATHLLTRKLQSRGMNEAADAREISTMVDHALTNTRSIARGFFTAGFDVMSLAEALREVARNVQERTGIQCSVEWQDNLVIHNEDVVMHLFRIAQEAVQNAVKHGEPSRIDISLKRVDGGDVELAIEDDGNGLKPSSKSPKGLGMRIMAYRVGIIGGELKVVSEPSGGVRITCRIPAQKISSEPMIASQA